MENTILSIDLFHLFVSLKRLVIVLVIPRGIVGVCHLTARMSLLS